MARPETEASRLSSSRKLLAGPIHGQQRGAQVFPEAPALPGCVTSDKVPSTPRLGPSPVRCSGRLFPSSGPSGG